jgi:hypothetical protein
MAIAATKIPINLAITTDPVPWLNRHNLDDADGVNNNEQGDCSAQTTLGWRLVMEV